MISTDSEEVALVRACFENVLSTEIPKVFNPTIIGAILGYNVPSGLISNNEMVDLSDFTFPLEFFRDGFYIDNNMKLQRKEGSAVYFSRGNQDGDRFFFTNRNFTSNRIKLASSFFDWMTPDAWTAHAEELKSLKLETSCSVKNCPAKRAAKFDRIQKIEEGSKNFAYITDMTRLNAYEVVLKQSSSSTQHSHTIVDPTSMRGHLPYNLDDLSQSYKVAEGVGTRDITKISQRCDIRKLPENLRPNENLLRQQLQTQPLRPPRNRTMSTYTGTLHNVGQRLGDDYFSQSSQVGTSHQVKGDMRREGILAAGNKEDTPWRHLQDIQGKETTNSQEGNKYSPEARVSLLQSYLDVEATAENKKNADIMTALSLHPGIMYQLFLWLSI